MSLDTLRTRPARIPRRRRIPHGALTGSPASCAAGASPQCCPTSTRDPIPPRTPPTPPSSQTPPPTANTTPDRTSPPQPAETTRFPPPPIASSPRIPTHHAHQCHSQPKRISITPTSRWRPYRSPRDETVSTPSGPGGSSGRSGFGCRGAMGTVTSNHLHRAYAQCLGEVSERSKEHAWKVCIGLNLSRVRIPPSPPIIQQKQIVTRFVPQFVPQKWKAWVTPPGAF